MSLGKSMEKLLTLSTENFEKYRKSNSDQITEEERNASEEFHYTGMGDFLLRSQLDAHDARLPGTGMFDLKTRAVISVRMDTDAYEDGRGYEIRGQHGAWESFEREYYDMICLLEVLLASQNGSHGRYLCCLSQHRENLWFPIHQSSRDGLRSPWDYRYHTRRPGV